MNDRISGNEPASNMTTSKVLSLDNRTELLFEGDLIMAHIYNAY